MKHYIDADKLKAEIERRYKEYHSNWEKTRDPYLDGKADALDLLLPFITSLQQEQPSLPPNLDEAAEEYESSKDLHWYEQQSPFELTRNAFKTGAEWMAGQGETIEKQIFKDNKGVGILMYLDEKFYNQGDKVIVQIRKK